MRTFKDSAGRVWEININVSAVKKCRAYVSVDIFRLIDDGGKPLAELLRDVCKFVDLLYVLCLEQCTARSLTDEDFGRSLGGDSLAFACDAFMEELIDFFPDPKVRSNLRKLTEAGRKIRDMVTQNAADQLDNLDMEKMLEALMKSHGKPPELPA